MKNHGWRKPTPGLEAAEQLAQAGEQIGIPKNQALLSIKRVAAHLGLKAGDMMLLDTLAAFTKPQDWEEGARPIVWPSNAYLMDQTGFSLSALKRHARRLAHFGAICFKDSPNGKRWGRRDATGHIIEAYGFDLAPIAARALEFQELFQQIKQERDLCLRIKRQITIARRAARAKIDSALSQALSGPWIKLRQMFEEIIQKLPKSSVSSKCLLTLLDLFQDLLNRVDKSLSDISKNSEDKNGKNTAETQQQQSSLISEMDPKGANNEPHILSTKQHNIINSNAIEKKHSHSSEQKPELTPTAITTQQVLKEGTAADLKVNNLDIGVVMQACPEFAEMAHNIGGYVNSWNELHRVAGQVRPMIGVTETAWFTAQDRLGPDTAAAAIALIFDKFSSGDVLSPGGYLRGMINKAAAGELHLERSFFGRLSNDKLPALT